MDPITAIGLISGIISFVDTAAKIIKLARVIYDSVEGSPEEMAARSEVSADMFLMSQLLARPSQAAVTPDPDEQSLVALAGRCAALSATIIEEVDSLKPKRPGSKTGVLRAALKMLRVEPKIKDLESQRQRCRDQLNIHILALSNRDIKTLMESLRQDGIKLTQIDGSMRQLRSALAEIEVQTLSEKALKQLGDILHIGQDVLDQIAQERILQGVKGGFEDMDYRYQAVDRPYGNTFEWVWNADGDGNSSPSVKIIQWMLSDSGIFHLCGKIGSGKSTLMKKLCDHVKTRAALQKWADANGERELVMANFFFYALGTDARQKSVLGLYRTLLHQILARSPGFTPHVFPDQWNKALSQPTLQTAISILDDEITTAFERLARYHDAFSVGKYCFALFVDGLDEYEETTSIDRREMVKLLTDLANNKTFKICVSSRPENPFLDLFDEGSRVYLHDLTKTDLIEYVEGKLQDVDSSDERQQLASAITSKAEGVFLWVVLVIQRIRSQDYEADPHFAERADYPSHGYQGCCQC
ncbi:hypothetical protein P8C59_000506 [Phyllachora maydis]|uniref:Nephrocystin 3-like N-terminal domain-containing protein n=1 Tax=Phyllachora maydis TaxID=1825666 RepID=A0AAD9HWH0_9PEZI|nr:hypothetical protein P8C59_000506 [Phyllachora maydis]